MTTSIQIPDTTKAIILRNLTEMAAAGREIDQTAIVEATVAACETVRNLCEQMLYGPNADQIRTIIAEHVYNKIRNSERD